MSLPPLKPDKTAAGIVVDPRTLERVVPTSKRSDGTLRKEIRIRPGFTPQEDVSRFKTARQAHIDATRNIVPGSNGRKNDKKDPYGRSTLTPDDFPSLGAAGGAAGKSKAQAKNEKRRANKNRDKMADMDIKWDEDEDEDDDEAGREFAEALGGLKIGSGAGADEGVSGQAESAQGAEKVEETGEASRAEETSASKSVDTRTDTPKSISASTARPATNPAKANVPATATHDPLSSTPQPGRADAPGPWQARGQGELPPRHSNTARGARGGRGGSRGGRGTPGAAGRNGNSRDAQQAPAPEPAPKPEPRVRVQPRIREGAAGGSGSLGTRLMGLVQQAQKASK